MKSPRRTGFTPWVVLTVSGLLTITATAVTAWIAGDRDQARLENAVQNAQDRIISRLNVYISTLRGGAALFAASDSVTSEDFRRYAERLDLQRRYPGIQGIGWTQRIASGWPAAPTERHSIRYLEPLDLRNRAAIGFDMASEPTRRAAMDLARDRGEPSLSGKVELVQEIFGPKQAGFLIYVPVYGPGPDPQTLEERRLSLRGFVYSPFRANDLFAGIFGSEEEPRVSFVVYDGMRTDSAARLYRSAAARGHSPRFVTAGTVQVAGHAWTVVYATEPSFEAGSAALFAPAVLVAGLIVSALLFWLTLTQARARAAAEAAASAKGRFLATMSHELRTPLNAIGGYVDLLQLEVAGPVLPQQREYLSRVQRAQQHLLGLINNILNFAKLEAGGVHFTVTAVPLPPIIAEAQSLVAPQLAAKDIRFRVQPGPDAAVAADTEKVRQILLNLLSNAVKFTEPGGCVEVDWRVNGRAALIRVRDSGIGIPADRLEHIFDPFVQVDADLARTRQGTGLGLAIARELAQRMGGDITVESAVGKGSTFTVQLPLHDTRNEGRPLATA